MCNEFRRLFAHSSFRKVVRRITAGRGDSNLGDLKTISGNRTDEYVRFLVELGVAEISNNEVRLTRTIDNIGPTLEWYVADMFQRAFEGRPNWLVKLADLQSNVSDLIYLFPLTLSYS